MRSRLFVEGVGVGALFFLAQACSGSGPNSRCSTANCQVLANCKVALLGMPRDPGECISTGEPGSISSYCPEACQANGNGALVECIATKFGAACPNPDAGAGAVNEITEACGVSDAGPCGPNCTSCQMTCESAWAKCNQDCPDAGVCLDCEYQCSQTQVSCQNACPTN